MDQLIKEETGNVMDSMEIGDSHLAKQIAKRRVQEKQQNISNLIEEAKFGEHEFNGLSEKFQKFCDRSGNINKKGFRRVMTEFIHDQKEKDDRVTHTHLLHQACLSAFNPYGCCSPFPTNASR